MNKKNILYVFVGILTVFVDYATVFSLWYFFDLNYIYCVFVGFIFSNIFQFYSNFVFTFSEKKAFIYEKIVVFWLAVGVGSYLAMTVTIFFYTLFQNVFYAKTMSLPVSFFYGYVVSTKIIYNNYFYFVFYKYFRRLKKLFLFW